MPDLQSRDVEQSAGTYGVFKLLGWLVLCELRGDRQRDVSRVSAGAVVARGQPELQLVSLKLAGGGGERVAGELHLRRRVHGSERRAVLGMRCGAVQKRDRIERVRSMPGGDVVVGRGECVFLSCEYIRTTRPELCRVYGQSVRTGTEHRQGGVCL